MSPKVYRLALAAAFAGLSIGCADHSTAPGTEPDANTGGALAPLYSRGSPEQTIRDRYIVVFRWDADRPLPRALELLQAHRDSRLHHTYGTALRGFAATLPPAAIDAIRRLPFVAFVETDQEVTVVETQFGATWGLDRVDQADLPLDASYTYTTGGTGVNVYILDTGIRTSHAEFGGRASVAYDAVGGDGQDCNGHGTHVAGTVGGATYGVAKGASLYAVRVLNCSGSGSTSGVIAGIDWVTSNAASPAVANMSLGGGDRKSVV